MNPARDILYLEDDDDLRAVVNEILRDEGYDVTCVANAADALASLQRERFRLLLTDYHLPDNDASWLLREAHARSLLKDTQIIVLTSESAPRGVDGLLLLKKPVEGATLLTEIARCVEAPAVVAAVPAAVPDVPASVVPLSLCVSSSLDSMKAVRNLRRILQEFDAHRIEVNIQDVSAASEQKPRVHRRRSRRGHAHARAPHAAREGGGSWVTCPGATSSKR